VKSVRFIKIFYTLLLSTLFVLGFSHLGANAYEKFVLKAKTYGPNTSIASVNVSGKSEAEARELLLQKIEEWKLEGRVSIRHVDKEIHVKTASFTFDIEKTLNSATNNGNELIVTIPEEELKAILTNNIPSINLARYDIGKVKNKLEHSASSLNPEIALQLEDFISDSQEVTVVSQVQKDMVKTTSGVRSFIETFPSIKIEGSSQFSLMHFLKNEGFTIEQGQNLSVISSIIYELLLPTNFSIAERNTSLSLPSYAKLGYEAHFDTEKNMDFVFANPNQVSYEIQFELEDNIINTKLIGIPFPHQYNVMVEGKETFLPRTIKQFSPFISKGDMTVKEQGEEGSLIKVYRQTLDPRGQLLEETLLAEDFYPPVHRIELHPIEEATVTNEISDSNSDVDSKNNKDEKSSEGQASKNNRENNGNKKENVESSEEKNNKSNNSSNEQMESSTEMMK
jgi:VanW like protein